MSMNILILYYGGTIGMVGKPLVVGKDAKQLMRGIGVPKDVRLTLLNAVQPKDSTNITYADRALMVEDIKAVYDDYNAFIILHGTDTLDVTLAYLCLAFGIYMRKPLFVIGSQQPRGTLGGDAEIQLANTLTAAVEFVNSGIEGVYTVSLNDVLLGARVCKRSDMDYRAFHTPGVLPVAKVAGGVVRLQPSWGQAHVANYYGLGWREPMKLERNISHYVVSADHNPMPMGAEACTRLVKGIILTAKGSGNIPEVPWGDGIGSWVDVIRAATNSGVPVGIQSPFPEGCIELGKYGPGSKAQEAGAISFGSLTPAMAEVKFRVALARRTDIHDPSNREMIEDYMLTNVVGELL